MDSLTVAVSKIAWAIDMTDLGLCINVIATIIAIILHWTKKRSI